MDLLDSDWYWPAADRAACVCLALQANSRGGLAVVGGTGSSVYLGLRGGASSLGHTMHKLIDADTGEGRLIDLCIYMPAIDGSLLLGAWCLVLGAQCLLLAACCFPKFNLALTRNNLLCY